MIIFIIIVFMIIFVAKKHYKKTNIDDKNKVTPTNVNTLSMVEDKKTELNFVNNKIEYQKKLKVAQSNFFIATVEYENLLRDYNYKIFYEELYEKIYCVNEDFFVFIGIDDWNGYNEEGLSYPHILIEELSYNYLFKFNATQFEKNFNNVSYNIRVQRFYGIKSKYTYNKLGASKFFEIDKKHPELKLLERAEKWEGVPCHYMIVELYDEKGSATTIKYLTNDKLEKEAQSFCKKIETFNLHTEIHNKINHKALCEKLNKMKENYKSNTDKNKSCWTLRGHLRYFFISERTTDYDLQTRGKQLLDVYNNGGFKEIDWREYGRFDGKWKSELLVFEYCQKLYGKDNVLFQYSPSFLGQMSYDVYIISKNVAIEYQGKQHFEPVEFFGGQEHFKKQVIRDKLKNKLSKENDVKLVYINYNEIISEKLIKERVESILQN